MLAALASAAPAQADDCAFADSQAGTATTHQLDDATVCLLNEQRAEAGLQPLAPSTPLTTTAQRYAEYMVSDRHFAHQDESGHNVVGRVLATDPSLGDRWLVLGENLGWGSYSLATPRSMVEGWMNSPTHRDNILFAEYDEIGVGITRGAPVPGSSGGALTYTTVFGKVAPAPAPRTATTRNRCLRRARVKAHRARSHRARVRAAKAKRACLAKSRAARAG